MRHGRAAGRKPAASSFMLGCSNLPGIPYLPSRRTQLPGADGAPQTGSPLADAQTPFPFDRRLPRPHGADGCVALARMARDVRRAPDRRHAMGRPRPTLATADDGRLGIPGRSGERRRLARASDLGGSCSLRLARLRRRGGTAVHDDDMPGEERACDFGRRRRVSRCRGGSPRTAAARQSAETRTPAEFAGRPRKPRGPARRRDRRARTQTSGDTTCPTSVRRRVVGDGRPEEGAVAVVIAVGPAKPPIAYRLVRSDIAAIRSRCGLRRGSSSRPGSCRRACRRGSWR